MRARSFGIVCLMMCGVVVAAQSPNPSAPAKPSTQTCNVDRSAPSEGDSDLSSEDYDAALKYFRDALAKDPASAESHLGLVRAMIGKDEVTEALNESKAELAKHPESALATVAAGEAAFRDAQFLVARTYAVQALRLDPCEGRAYDLAADLYSVTANFATAASLLNHAHALLPNDELIRRDWIDSLPRSKRQVELNRYMAESPHLSNKERIDEGMEQSYLKARKPGECHITSKAESVSIPFKPIFYDGSHMEAFGLEVAFNGKKRRMQIDTGASGIVLTPSAAKRLALVPEYQLKTGGVGDDGEVDSYLTHVSDIEIGDVQISNCMVTVLKKTNANMDVDGLIGIDVFERWLATLDYQNEKLVLKPLPPRPDAKAKGESVPGSVDENDDEESETLHNAYTPPEMQDWLHVIRIGHDLLLPSTINGGAPRYMLMDTGAAMTSFSLAYAKENGKVHEDPYLEFSGISGKVKKTYDIDRVKLTFGNLALPESSYPSFDLTTISHDEGVEVSGFMGLPTLSRLAITIDYRDNLVQMKYDPKHDMQRF